MIKIHSAEYMTSCVAWEKGPKEMVPEIAFIGRSNVGKSSLINSLLNRKGLAKVSSTPGKTQTINFFSIATSAAELKHFTLVDLPGFGYAKVSQDVQKAWGPMIENYLANRAQLQGVVFLFDTRRADSPDVATAAWLREFKHPCLYVGTKVDKLKRSERNPLEKKVRQGFKLSPDDPMILYSSQTHEGRDELWKGVRKIIGEGPELKAEEFM